MTRARPLVWCAIVLGLVATGLAPAGEPATRVAAANPGEAIYRLGVLASGAPLEASRDAATGLQGAAVACINCHRRSGLGTKEGRALIPPVAARYLFKPRVARSKAVDLPYVEGSRADREPYTDATLARAIREGLDSQGRPLSYLMPRYAMDDANMGSLIAYLKQLDQPKVPGVTDADLQFATIITPDADPVKRRAMLDVIEQYFADRNATQRAPTAALLPSGKTAFSKMMFKVNRRWALHVWELSGPESTWREQLDRKLAAQPVFAVISGLGGRNWAPVHEFCERSALPCLFPNVEAPPADADADFYSLYLSRGVLLEAELIAKRIADAAAAARPARVRQVYRRGDSGEIGARAFAAALQRHGVGVSNLEFAPEQSGAALADALHDPSNPDPLVLWLRPADLAALAGALPPAAPVYLSGLMGGLERAPLAPAWRDNARMAYPFELPERRRARVNYAHGWFRVRQIPLVADQVQVDTYLACGLLAETLKNMVDAFVRDYLVERIEDTLEHRIVTGYYPRLTVSIGQRFASKGGYFVRFADPEGPRLIADQDWMVP